MALLQPPISGCCQYCLAALITAIGFALWLSALNVMYRDVGYIIPFLTQFWMYITPSLIRHPWFRNSGRSYMRLTHGPVWWKDFAGHCWVQGKDRYLIVDLGQVFPYLVTVSGLFYFRRMERKFADMVLTDEENIDE
jgi:lipopolysaccharide transport system permease protein